MASQKPETIGIEIAYAEPEQQWLLEERVPAGTTVGEALEKSRIKDLVPHLKIDRVGIWYQPVKLDQTLRDGDRIEIYRPLLIDPKERRRKKANKTDTADTG